MPGIVGLITKKPREYAERELLTMVSALRHDASYEAGTWTSEAQGVYVGWAERKNAFCKGMPVCNERGDIVLVFSGEEFPEPGTAASLRAHGHEFEPKGARYLAHLYEEDPSFPAGLNGWFHGLINDQSSGTTMLFNDRYGMHRLYYYESKEAFYFAAEAKAILAVRPELSAADPQGLGELIACGCVLDNRSIFQGIKVLPTASSWTFRNGSIEHKGVYFRPQEWEEQASLEPESYYQELREVFLRNLPRYFGGHEKIGMSLTGGLDTRMILAWKKPAPGCLPCYSFGGPFRDTRDIIVARQVAQECRQSYEVIRVGDEFLSRFPSYAERTVYLTDGCVSVNHCPDLYVNEQAARIAPVRMTGNYGGEVLRSVRAFKPSKIMPGLLCPELYLQVGAARETYAQLVQTHPLSFAVFRQAPWHHYGLQALEQTQLSLRSPYLDNDFVRTVFQAPRSASTNNDISLRLIADGDAVLRKIRTDRGVGGDQGHVVEAISKRFLEFTFKAEYAYDYGMPQWLARIDHLFAPFHLERLFLARHKFAHFRIWYRDALSKYVRDMLLDPRTLSRPYLERNTVETIVQRHLRGDRNYTTEIHKTLTLELIHRLFLDSTPQRTEHHRPSEAFVGSA